MPKTLSDIIPPSRRRQMMEVDSMGGTQEPEPPRMPPSRPQGKSKRFPYLFTGGAVLIVIACVIALFVFSGATVKVMPTVNKTSVSGEWTVTPSAGELPYEVVTVDKTLEEEVPAEGNETVTVPAQGTITIYNAQDKVQELIKNTRFQTPDGKIYRIQSSIKVPAGSASAPGTLKATVYADAAGEAYNVGPTTFTLPGLSGSPLYDLVYAKSDEGMAGGFSGTRPSISSAKRTEQYDKMRPSLESQLASGIQEKIPEGYVLVQGATNYSYTELPDASGTSSSVKVQYKGTATAFVFPNQALAKAIAYKVVAKYDGQPITLVDATGMTLTQSEEAPLAQGAQSAVITLTGNATLVWDIDEAQITEAIAGKNRSTAKTLLKGFPEIADFSIVIRPFWDSTLPENPTEIRVVLEKPDLK